MPSLFKMISHFLSFLRSCAKPASDLPVYVAVGNGRVSWSCGHDFIAKHGVFLPAAALFYRRTGGASWELSVTVGE